jgi:hypothetical protein
MLKYRWKLPPAPTGRYRSFEKRGWPDAMVGDTCIASIHCEDNYVPRAVKVGKHKPLTISVRCEREVTAENRCKWRWRKLKGEFLTLADAKLAFAQFIEKYPEHNFVLDS